MGWITEKFADNPQSASDNSALERTFESSAERVWARMMAGFQKDVEEFNSRHGDADFEEISAHEGRISNGAMNIAVVVTADLAGHTIHYQYEPGDEKTAVPEQGILTMRPSASGIELYSADENLNPDAARRLILEPLFFANPPLQDTGS